MSTRRAFEELLTNPLPNVASGLTARDVYTEVHGYGPEGPPGSDGEDVVHRSHRWTIDAAAGGEYTRALAVWDGDLTIDGILNPDETDPDKILVRLALAHRSIGLPEDPQGEVRLRTILPTLGRVPTVALYENIVHASLREAVIASGYTQAADGQAIAEFLNLARFGQPEAERDPAHMLPLHVGDELGEVGIVPVGDGTLAPTLEFSMVADRYHPERSVYPDALYAGVWAQPSPPLLHGVDERDPRTSLWSVCLPRAVLWFTDEWNAALGTHREATLTLTRPDGEVLTKDFRAPAGDLLDPVNAVAVEDWVWLENTVVEISPLGSPPSTGRLMLSLVPSVVAATDRLEVVLTPPGELVVQALDPADWFPSGGGTGWDPVARAHVPVHLPAPHGITRPWTNENRVVPLIDGHAYFLDLVAEIKRIAREEDYLLMAGWWLDEKLHPAQVFDPETSTYVGEEDGSLHDIWVGVVAARAKLFVLAANLLGGPHVKLADALPEGQLKRMWVSRLQDLAQAGLGLARWLAAVQVPGPYDPNAGAVEAVDSLPGTPNGVSEAILDGRLRPGGSHHTKLAVVRRAGGLVAWVGGIDVHVNRLVTQAHTEVAKGQEQYHDVQCRVEGPAAREVLRTFISRWNDHPTNGGVPLNSKTADLQCDPLGFTADGHLLLLEDTDTGPRGTDMVQIARTAGNCRGLADADIPQNGTFTTDAGYSFAPDGEFGIEAAVLGAIRRARHSIYIEDQFLTDLKIATAVAERIEELKDEPEPLRVQVVVTRFPATHESSVETYLSAAQALDAVRNSALGRPPIGTDLLGTMLSILDDAQLAPARVRVVDPFAYGQSRWYDILHQADPDHRYWQMCCVRLPPCKAPRRVRTTRFGLPVWKTVWVPVSLPDRRLYLHSKVVIVDDVWATIGSANMNVRSHTSDTEVNCCFVDGRIDQHGSRVSVRDLRRALWAEHLGVNLKVVRYEPAHHRESIAYWSRGIAESASLRPGEGKPWAKDALADSRLYLWPHDECYVPASNSPKVEFLAANGAVLEFPGYPGLDGLELYWWLTEGYGKAPWLPDADELIPPPIGSDRFAVDGDTGNDYVAHNLQ